MKGQLVGMMPSGLSRLPLYMNALDDSKATPSRMAKTSHLCSRPKGLTCMGGRARVDLSHARELSSGAMPLSEHPACAAAFIRRER